MFGKTNPEVLVVGAGPVGLCAALTLAKHGIPVMVVDREWRTGAHSYALALHPHSLMLLAELGILDEVLAAAHRVRRIGLYDDCGRRAEVAVCGADDTSLPLAVMRQDLLERTLEEALRRAGVEVLWNHALSRLTPQSDGAVATIDTLVKESVGYAVARTEWVVAKSRDVRVPFVIGADGHHSLVRRSLGIDFPEVGPAQHYAVFEFSSNVDLGDEMRLMIGDRHTDVLWPLPERHCRWSFELLDETVPETTRTKNRIPVDIGSTRFPRLDLGRLRELMSQRAPWFTGQVERIFWRIMVRFERRLASAFGRDRVWLAGDAGHLTGPAGMQSMNVGLQEAKQLGDLIAGIVQRHESATQLEAYGAQRLTAWQSLLGLQGSWATDDATDAWIRQASARLLPCLPASGVDLSALASQLGLHGPQVGR
jgi:2-polyprenyl-6-methoxyphenol hydroxylase-like FAD-dependent oxidoreductase